MLEGQFQNHYDNFKNGNSCGEACNSRTEVVLAGSNGGIMHAFDTKDGNELWGYIPPNIIGKLKTMITTHKNTKYRCPIAFTCFGLPVEGRASVAT